MLGIDVILIPILGGFLFIKYCNITKYRAIRDNGYVILFKSSAVGLSFFSLSYFFWLSLSFDHFKKFDGPTEFYSFLIHEHHLDVLVIPALGSLGLMLLIYIASNYVIDDDMMKIKVIKDDNDSLERTLLRCFDEEKDVQITLDTNKVYIGKVTETFYRVQDEIKSIQISPLVSGYRNTTQELVLHTFYGPIYEDISQNPESYKVKISDFLISISFNRVVSINPFDLDTYEKFQQGKVEPPVIVEEGS